LFDFNYLLEMKNAASLLRRHLINGIPIHQTTSKLKPHILLQVAIPEKRWKLRKTIELFKLGHSIHEVAKQLGKSREGVRIQLQQAGFLPPQEINSTQFHPKVLRGKVRWNSPYGFKYERGHGVRHPQEYETFQIIMKLKKSGLNAREIADRLNVQKLRPRIAKKWDRCTVHRIFEWHEQHPDFLKEVLSWESKNSSR
jgi:hypothetical protein